MKHLLTKNILILVLLALIFILLFFRPTKTVKINVPFPTKEVVTKLVKDTIAIKKTVDSMKRNEAVLRENIKATTKYLRSAEKLVSDLLNNTDLVIDSSGKEELKLQVHYLKAAVQLKDSLCNTTIATQDSLVTNLEGQLTQKDSLASKLRFSLNQVLLNENIKDKHIKDLNKQFRNQKLKKNVWKVGAGAAVIYIIAQTLKQ